LPSKENEYRGHYGGGRRGRKKGMTSKIRISEKISELNPG